MDVMLVLLDINAKIQEHPYLLFVQLDFIGQQLQVIFVYSVHLVHFLMNGVLKTF